MATRDFRPTASYYGRVPTIRDLGGDDITRILLANGQARADLETRGADIWTDAIKGIGENASNALMQSAKMGEDEQIQKAVSAAMGGTSRRTPGFDVSGNPVQETAEALDLNSILAKIQDPAVRGRAMKSIQDMQMTRGKFLEQNLQVEELKGKLKDAETKRLQDAANHWGTLGLNLEQHYNDPDGGITFASFGMGFSKDMPGAEKLIGFAQQAGQAYEEARATGDKMQMQMVKDQFREQSQPIVDRGKAAMDQNELKAWYEARKAAQPETTTLKTRDAAGNETEEIVAKVPGVKRTSAPEPAKPGSFEDAVVKKYGRNATPEQILEMRKLYGQADDRNINIGGMGGLYGGIDPKAIAGAIQRGEQPPVLTDLGRPVGAAVSSELAKSGYNLSRAVTDWKATQKHVASLNGSQQLRLNQAVNALPDLLDSVDTLATQWKGGRFPVLNKANLALAKGGAYGPDVASVANKLDAQVADVVADLAVVYMGGNSPTDHGLQLAGKSLSGDWDEKVLRDMVKMAKGNVVIRRNSILNTGVAGASPDNKYVTPTAETTPAAGGTGEVTATGPNGQKLALRNGQWVPVQ